MPRPRRSARRALRLVEPPPHQRPDFSDRESQRVLTVAASAVARELGREAAREYFAELLGKAEGS